MLRTLHCDVLCDQETHRDQTQEIYIRVYIYTIQDLPHLRNLSPETRSLCYQYYRKNDKIFFCGISQSSKYRLRLIGWLVILS